MGASNRPGASGSAGSSRSGTSNRRSPLGGDEVRLVFGDLHNHSVLSDGTGDPERAFEMMRDAQLEVAALTDHASIPRSLRPALGLQQYPNHAAVMLARTGPNSIDDAAWARTARIADAHDVPGRFTALRGFEWTEPWLGHVNVWFSGGYHPVLEPGRLDGLQQWLLADEPGALFGYNHPGREPGRLDEFAPPPVHGRASLLNRMVTLEAFNRFDDFLLHGPTELESPLVRVLDAGWRPGLVGSSDEHGRSYGVIGKGRTGLWVHELSRAGVREALLARRVFATREVGLTLDATLDGVRMGGVLPAGDAGEPRSAVLRVYLAGPAYLGLRTHLQVLVSDGTGRVATAKSTDAVVGEVTTVELALPRTPWMMLRIADPDRQSGLLVPPGHVGGAWALAYASPWWFGH